MGTLHALKDDLIDKAEFDARLAAHGVSIATRDIRNWRTRGIFPMSYRGGLSAYSSGSVEQALEISRLMAQKDRLGFVGWELWWGGYDVAEQFWRPTVESRGSVGFEITRAAVGVLATGIGARAEAIETGCGRAVRGLLKALGLEPETQEDDMSVIAEMRAFLSDLAGCARTPVMCSLLFKNERLKALESARDDVRTGFEALGALNRAVDDFYGPRVMSLRSAAWFGAKATKETRAELTLIWTAAKALRADPATGGEQSALDFVGALSAAKRLEADMAALKAAVAERPGLDKIVNKRAFRAAIERADARTELIDQVAEHR